jgi:methyl-accepting chemotaxis protein
MKLSIRMKMVLGMAVIILLLVGQLFFSYDRLSGNVEAIEDAQQHDLAGAKLASALEIELLKLHEQFLSLSAGLDSAQYSSSLAELDRKAESFRTKLETLEKLHTDDAENLDQIRESFEWYYTSGHEMVQTYIRRGPGVGKVLLPAAIAVHDEVTVKLETLVKEMEAEADEAILSAINQVATVRQIMAILTIVIIVLGFAVVLFVSTQISRNIGKCVGFAEEISRGNLSGSLEIKSKDETGALARSLNHMNRQLRQLVSNVAQTVSTVSGSAQQLSAVSSQLTTGADDVSSGTSQVASASEEIATNVTSIASAAEESSSIVDNLASMSEEMSVTIKDIASNTTDTNAGIQRMSQDVETASEGINNIAATVQQMNASIQDVAKRTTDASRISIEASDMAVKATDSMSQLTDIVQAAATIVDTIKEIADQTNMLALNATIEAAGAGEAGKGFAVVATEVKELARQSAEATEQIRQQIDSIMQNTGDVEGAIKGITEIIGRVSEINETIASAMREQGSAVDQTSQTLTGVTKSASTAAGVAKEVSSAVDNIARSAGEASTTATEVARNVAEASTAVREIARSIEDTSVGVKEISKNTGTLGNTSHETASAARQSNQLAHDLNEFSSQLQEVIKRFQLGDEKFDIAEVKTAHLAWRSKLEGVLNGSSSLRPEEVTSHHACEFGKWFYSDAGQALAGLPGFDDVEHCHEDVHSYARQIVELIQDGRQDEANKLMEAFEEARRCLFIALDQLHSS